MKKTELFCIKTDAGYGLFQKYKSYSEHSPFYLIYYNQVKDLSEKAIDGAMAGEYYYERFAFDCWVVGFDERKLIQNKGIEFHSSDFNIKDNDFSYGDTYLTYLGDYPLPKAVEIPRYTRQLDFSYYTGEHGWVVHDELNRNRVRQENGKVKIYKSLIEEISYYPRLQDTPARELREHFNTNYRPEDFNDAWFAGFLENYYQEHPHMRPTDEKYEDVKLPLPTTSWRNILEDVQEEKAYLAFCDRVESALKAFLGELAVNQKTVNKPLMTLINQLNKIAVETELIGSLEAEELFGYLAKILMSLKKAQLIEKLENLREW